MATSMRAAMEAAIQAKQTNILPNDLATQIETCIQVSGYQGDPPVVGWTRVYFTARSDEYIDVKDDQVFGTVELGGANSPLVMLLLSPEAEIQHVVSMNERISAQFLDGEIAQQHLTDNRVGVNTYIGQQGMVFGQTNNCGSLGRACGSLNGGCGSLGRACGSWVGC